MKITYLFGAGASAHALPIVSAVPDRIMKIIEILNDKINFILGDSNSADFSLKTKQKASFERLLFDLEWLASESKNHASIDTFAKKLFIKEPTNSPNLKRLKIALSVFFVIEQTLKKVDYRYDSFFASLLTDKIDSLPNNVRVLNWNYDFQFEKAFSDYTELQDIDSNYSSLNIVSKFSNFDTINEGFKILKLNGTTTISGSDFRRNDHMINFLFNDISIDFFNALINKYEDLNNRQKRFEPNLSFAFESDNSVRNIINIAKTETADTDILIVIGYSFPFFNREIDRNIIGNMKNLSKVYFQSPEANIIRERFSSIRTDIDPQSLIPYYEVNQFLIPNEL